MNIAVVDTSGQLVYFERMEGRADRVRPDFHRQAANLGALRPRATFEIHQNHCRRGFAEYPPAAPASR